MYTWETIDKTLDYIEEHLTEEIKTETLAEMANLSLFYYQRIFKRLVKKPVQEYIKLRRLALALRSLKQTGSRIIDTAITYGFSDHANFTRAFKETYHITPGEYRKNLPMLNTFDRPDILSQYTMIDENVPLITGNIVLEIQRKTLKDAELYLGFEKEINMAGQIPPGESTGIDVPGVLWNAFHTKKATLSDTFQDETELGMSHMANPERGTFHYFAGGLIKPNQTAQYEDMTIQTLPPGEYIVCRIEAETFEYLVTTALNQAIKYVYETWLQNKNLCTKPFSAEKYYKDNTKINYMELWIMPANPE